MWDVFPTTSSYENVASCNKEEEEEYEIPEPEEPKFNS